MNDKKLLRQKLEKQVCMLYQDNILISKIAETLSIGRHRVTRILQKHNVYDPDRSKVHLSKERLLRNEHILKLFKIGYSHRQIAEMLNMGKSDIGYVLKKFYTDNSNRTGRLDPKARYPLNENFFEQIDTEQKAYWLGFLYADGCITKKTIRLDLAEKDKEHLSKFKKDIGAPLHKILYQHNMKSVLVVVGSKKMVNDLTDLGCSPQKTFTLEFPIDGQVPPELIHHFMRGYFDGDGCISLGKQGQAHFCIIGTDDFIRIFKDVLFIGINKQVDVKVYHHKTSKGIVILNLGGNKQAKKIHDFLYKDATIYLNRKKEKFNQIISRLETRAQKSQEN